MHRRDMDSARLLDDFDSARRGEALQALARQVRDGVPTLPPEGTDVNLHLHSFFSFNAEGCSPSRLAWRARQRGLAAAGLIDFDVLDGLDEFLAAGRLLGLRTVVGIESRVFVPEFATRAINSPGEPGIAYHLGLGFPRRPPPDEPTAPFLARLKETAQRRNREMVARVNETTAPVRLDMDRDVLPLTPAGNVTERHLCLAYAQQAARRFPDPADLARFWTERLGQEAADLDFPDGPRLQALIRAKTMKTGGVGYMKPDPATFPDLAAMNRFSLAAGALPVMTWLDGSSPGEQAIDEWLDLCQATGVEAVNVIPARNIRPGVQDENLARLQDLIARVRSRHLPLLTGTEMNAPGQPFVDAFDSEELAPYRDDFLRGGHILFAHSLLQTAAGMGYASAWATAVFPDRADRNAWFARIGRGAAPALDPACLRLDPALSPTEAEQAILAP